MAVFLWVLAVSAQAQATNAFAQLHFEGLSADLQLACKHVAVSTAGHFQKRMGIPVGRIPIHVKLMPIHHLTVSGAEFFGDAHGVCVVKQGKAEVIIATEGPQAIAPILAHEITHAFIIEAFGEARNLFLNEGLAQYMAGLVHPPLQSQLRRIWLKGDHIVVASPYVAGFHFVEEKVGDPRFMDFFKRHINQPTEHFDELERLWERDKIQNENP